jgi:hypothetical protein
MYVPAGTWYGPHSSHGTESEAPTFLAALQFDGECKGGYIDFERADAASAALRKLGEFKDGFFYPNTPGEKKAQDAFEAAWEHATGKKIEYPASFVDAPIYMHIDAVPWVASGEPGVQRKMLGAFGNHGLCIGMSNIARGAKRVLRSTNQSIVAFCLTGEATMDGAPFSRYSALLLEPGETVTMSSASEETELIEVALPNFKRAKPEDRTSSGVERSLSTV